MTTAPPAVRAIAQTPFSVDKETHGGITLFTMHGTLNDAFEGRKLAGQVRGKKVLVNMREVRRFASWGMSEWMEFLRLNAERDLYLVECSTYAVSQINLVTGLLGHAKLVSFYASYRCGSCSEELSKLILIPRDQSQIRDLPNTTDECKTCGGRARLEEYPAAFFDTIAARPLFDIDDEVLAYLRQRLGYDLTPDLTRFRAYRRTSDNYTYLRLSGHLARLPADTVAAATHGTCVIDLDGAIYNSTDLAPWRSYVAAVTSRGTALQLDRCPPGFLEAAVTSADLHDNVKVRTFRLAYDCLRCEKQVTEVIDVAENLEQLVGGTAPTARCPTCSSLLVAVLGPEQVLRMRSLPARDRDPALEKFLSKARNEPADKLENCLAPLPAAAPAQKSWRGLATGLGLGTLIAGIVAVVLVAPWENTAPRAVAPPQGSAQPQPAVTPTPPTPTVERPPWVMSDIPSSAYCHDMINRLMCIGVSSYQPNREHAVAEANDAALEELVMSTGLKIGDGFFKDRVLSGYSDVRTKAISALEAADVDRSSETYRTAHTAVAAARKRVVDVLRRSGGPAVPAQRSDWYWEEYKAKQGGTEFLVFVRYDVTIDAVKVLVDKYSAKTQVRDSTVMTAFPALAWQYPDFTGGAIVTKAGRSLAQAKIAERDIIAAVGDQRVTDASSLVRVLDDTAQRKVSLSVKTGAEPARVVDVRLPR